MDVASHLATRRGGVKTVEAWRGRWGWKWGKK